MLKKSSFKVLSFLTDKFWIVPGINDPHTAIRVLDRLGASLCDMVDRELRNEVWLRDTRRYLVVPGVDYDGLTDAMFQMICQSAAVSTAVLIRRLDILTAVVSCEAWAGRWTALARHAALVADDAQRNIKNSTDLQDLLGRFVRFDVVCSKQLT